MTTVKRFYRIIVSTRTVAVTEKPHIASLIYAGIFCYYNFQKSQPSLHYKHINHFDCINDMTAQEIVFDVLTTSRIHTGASG